MSQTLPDAKAKHQKAIVNARWAYAAIMILFLTICTVAVVSMMAMEKDKTSFHAIEVKQPISFFDDTYVKKTPSKSAP
jgi:hypothetical protein